MAVLIRHHRMERTTQTRIQSITIIYALNGGTVRLQLTMASPWILFFLTTPLILPEIQCVQTIHNSRIAA